MKSALAQIWVNQALLVSKLAFSFKSQVRISKLDGSNLICSRASRVRAFRNNSLVSHLLIVDTQIVQRLSFGAVANLVAVFVRVESLHWVWVRILFFILSSCLRFVLVRIVSKMKMVRWRLSKTTSQILHQILVLTLVSIRLFPLEISLLGGFVDWFVITDFVVSSFEVVWRRNLFVGLGSFVVLHQISRLRNLGQR